MTDAIRELCEELDREGRAAAQSLEAQGIVPAGWTDQYYPLTPTEKRELWRLKLCAMLADTPEVYVALARRRAVPRARLRSDALRLLDGWPA